MNSPVAHLDDVQRRARLAWRHAFAPLARVADPVAATTAMTVLHATEPATVYLSLQARVDGLSVEDIDHELYGARSIVKQLAMRRTLFVFPRDLLPAVWGSASARIAPTLATRFVKELELGQVTPDGVAWLEAARRGVLAKLADGSELSAAELREQVPELQGRVEVAPDKPYGGSFPVSPRVLTQLGVEARIVRGRNGGHWRVSRPQWTSMEAWLGERPEAWSAADGFAELVRRWLGTFGPGTVADIQWWLGGTLGIVKAALAQVGAVQVSLDGDGVGYVLADDVDSVASPEPWAALLPVLDPTVMGWKQRDFYLGPHSAQLFDSNGNAGTTAWWDGRIVGCWVQEPDASVRVVLLEDVGAEGRAALAKEASRLSTWLNGVKVGTVYPSPAMKAAALRS